MKFAEAGSPSAGASFTNLGSATLSMTGPSTQMAPTRMSLAMSKDVNGYPSRSQPMPESVSRTKPSMISRVMGLATFR